MSSVREERVMQIRGALGDLNMQPALQHEKPTGAHAATSPWTPDPKSLTAPEKAFWKDAFIACARSTLLTHDGGDGMAPEDAATTCADFADAAMEAYRTRVLWRKK